MPPLRKMIGPLLPAARNGCPRALGEVLSACQNYLLTVARREIDPGLLPKGGASDLVQDTFLEAHRDFPQFNGTNEAELLSWLRKLLLNNLASFARRYRSTARRSIHRETSINRPGIDAATTRDTTVSPGDALESREEMQYLHELMHQLSGDYRCVLTLWYDERSFEEIGQLMGRSARAARMLWMRAIEHLRELVDQEAHR